MKTAYGLGIPETLEEICDPNRVALLVYNMQVGILSQIKNSEQITQKFSRSWRLREELNASLLFAAYFITKRIDGYVSIPDGYGLATHGLPEQINPWFLRDDPAFQIVPELGPRKTEGIFDKLTMSAFEGTWLDSRCGIVASTLSSSSA